MNAKNRIGQIYLGITEVIRTNPRGSCVGVVNNEGTVDMFSRCSSDPPNSMRELESNISVLKEVCEINDDVEILEGVRTSDEDHRVSVSVDVNEEILVGVSAPLLEEATESDNGGTGVSGGNGEGGSNDVEGVGVPGIVLRRSAEENVDPLGRRKDVSKEVSRPSGMASDLTEGDGSSCDDS